MGIFDASTYAPAQSGLIDRLMVSLGAPLQSGPGFPQSPMDANAAMPPQAPAQPQNAPIAVGNYMMPRVGSGFAPLPDGSLPRQTAAEQGAGVLPGNLPAQQPSAPSAQLPATTKASSALADTGVLSAAGPNFQDHALAAYQNLRHGGGLLGSVVAGITGQRNDPQAELQQQQARAVQQRYLAFKAAGIPDQKAVLAAIDPDAAKSIVGEAFGPDQYQVVQTGEDGLGRKAFQVLNKHSGELQPISGAGANSDAGGGLGNMNLTGKDYLASLPKAQANTVQGMVEGTIPPPSSFALSKPYWQNMIAAAKNYDPTFDSANWSGRVAGVKDFAAGKSAEMVRSANQTLHHVGSLLDSMDALNNGNYPLLNRIENAGSEWVGSGTQGAFRTNAHAVADEMAKVFKGAGISDSEIHAWESNLNENMSPEQQRAQIAKLRDLLQGSLQALDEKRVASIGPIAAAKQGPLIKDEGQRVLSRIDTWLNNGGGAAPQANQSAVEAEMRRRGLL